MPTLGSSLRSTILVLSVFEKDDLDRFYCPDYGTDHEYSRIEWANDVR